MARFVPDSRSYASFCEFAPGFSEAVLKEEPTRLLLVVNPAQRILPGIVEEFLRVLVDGAFYAHRLIGPELRAMAKGPEGGGAAGRDAWPVRGALAGACVRWAGKRQSFTAPVSRSFSAGLRPRPRRMAGKSAAGQPSWAASSAE